MYTRLGSALSERGSDASVVDLEFEVVTLALDQPFTIAGGSQDRAQIVLVRLRCADGSIGLGEAAPLPAYNGETIEQSVAAITAARPFLLGRDPSRWRELALGLRALTGASGAARCALETALLDALSRSRGCSLFAWFGGAEPPRLEIDVTIPIGSVSAAARAAERWSRLGFRALKIKVGGTNDLARVLAVRAHAENARLLLDANAGLDADGACRLVRALRAEGIELALFEQPVPRGDWDGLRRVLELGTRLALDESIVTAHDALLAIQHLGADVVLNVKLMKAGILEALDVVSVAKAGKASLMIGGMLESTLAMATSASFATGLGGFEFADLDTHLFMKDSPFDGGFCMVGSALELDPTRAGHGVRLSPTPPGSIDPGLES